MIRATAILMAALLSVSAHAESRQESIARLMRAQGLADMFDQQKQYQKIEGEKQAGKIIDQLLSNMKPNEKYRKKFSEAFMSYIKKLESPWSAEEATAAWAQYYGVHFSDSELNQLVAFYESPLGQKEQKASKDALIKFSAHLSKLSEPVLEKATNDFMMDLQRIAKECNCDK